MRNIVPLVIAICLLAPLGVAAAQPAAEMPSAEASYVSPMRGQCEQELRKDAEWRALLERQLRAKVHEEDASQMLTNKRHVTMAYMALWVLVVGFLAYMFMRQRALRREVEELEAELRLAAQE